MTQLAADDVRGMDWDDGLECWVVSSPVLARRVLNHPSFSSRTPDRLCQLYMTDEARREHRALTEFLRLWFVHTDDPEHAALRGPVRRLLSAAYVRSIAPRVTEIVDACLDDLAASRPHDVVPAVADGVSARVMAHVVGIDEAPAVLHTWSRKLSAFIAAMYRRDHARAAHEVMLEMTARLATAPAVDGLPRDTADDRARTTATWAMLLFGGLETTASLLGSAVLTVLRDAGAWAAVREDRPGAVEALVESVLRRRPPLRNVGRVVAHDVELAGARLRAGDLVLVPLTGGGLLTEDRPDPAGCPVSDRREPHLAFGFGAHYCVGAPLSRLEAATTLRRFVTRFPRARLAGEAPVWGENLSYVGLDHLYVDLDGGR